MPLASRAQAQDASQTIESMIARVENYVGKNPNDGRAWEVLAPVYMRVGRYDDAVRAWRNTISISGSNASREADLGEALVATANGVVTAEAKAAFDRAIALDPTDVMARFYIGMAADQDGRRADAEAIWRDLLAKAPPGAPWIEMVRHAMNRNAPAGTTPAPATAGMPGPTAADIAAASKLAPDQQNQMITGMVARLAERLKKDGSDAAGWVRLVRSYRVLGDTAKADAAMAEARRALANDPDKTAPVCRRRRPCRPCCPGNAFGAAGRRRRRPGAERRRHRGRRADGPGSAEPDDPRHGGAARRQVEAERRRYRRLAAPAARLYSARRARQGHRRRGRRAACPCRRS